MIRFGDYLDPLLGEELIISAAEARQAAVVAMKATKAEIAPGQSYAVSMRQRQTLRGDQAVSTAYQARAAERALQSVADAIAEEYMAKFNELRALYAAIDCCLGYMNKTGRLAPHPPPEPPEEFTAACLAIANDDRQEAHRQKAEVVKDFKAWLDSFDMAHDYKLPVVQKRDGSFAPVAER